MQSFQFQKKHPPSRPPRWWSRPPAMAAGLAVVGALAGAAVALDLGGADPAPAVTLLPRAPVWGGQASPFAPAGAGPAHLESHDAASPGAQPGAAWPPPMPEQAAKPAADPAMSRPAVSADEAESQPDGSC